jgi:hypothetical protein
MRSWQEMRRLTEEDELGVDADLVGAMAGDLEARASRAGHLIGDLQNRGGDKRSGGAGGEGVGGGGGGRGGGGGGGGGPGSKEKAKASGVGAWFGRTKKTMAERKKKAEDAVELSIKRALDRANAASDRAAQRARDRQTRKRAR